MQSRFIAARLQAIFLAFMIDMVIIAVLWFALQPMPSPFKVVLLIAYLTIGFGIGIYHSEQAQRHMLKKWQPYFPKVYEGYTREIVRFTFFGGLGYLMVGAYYAMMTCFAAWDKFQDWRKGSDVIQSDLF